MELISPLTLTFGSLTSASVAENDYPEWTATSAYAVGDRRIVGAKHHVYEAQAAIAANTNVSPDVDVTSATPKWLDLGYTNKFKCIDSKFGTQTTSSTGTLTLTFTPGQMCDSLALLNITGSQVEVTCKLPDNTVLYHRIIPLVSGSNVVDWKSYFMAPILTQTDVVLTDLQPYGTQAVTITITGAGTVGIGNVAVGTLISLGDLQMSPTIGITSFSGKAADAFGNVTVTPRAYSKRFGGRFMLENGRVDYIAQTLAALRDTPVVWMGVGSLYKSMVVWGFFKDFEIDIAYEYNSLCSITIEGLV
jgi:hypothetical protein